MEVQQSMLFDYEPPRMFARDEVVRRLEDRCRAAESRAFYYEHEAKRLQGELRSAIVHMREAGCLTPLPDEPPHACPRLDHLTCRIQAAQDRMSKRQYKEARRLLDPEYFHARFNEVRDLCAELRLWGRTHAKHNQQTAPVIEANAEGVTR